MTSSPSKTEPTLLADIRLIFQGCAQPDFRAPPTLAHGRIEQRAIWSTSRLNHYLNFPGVGQVFVIERDVIQKTTGKRSTETVYGPSTTLRTAPMLRPSWPTTGVTGPSRTAAAPSSTDAGTKTDAPSSLVTVPRTSPPYAASPSAIKAKSRDADAAAATIQRLARNVRLVFDYLGATETPAAARGDGQSGRAGTD